MLQSDGSHVALAAPNLSVDVHEFRRAVESNDFASAVRLYAGQLLPGFAEEWIVPQTLELEESFANAVCGLVEEKSRARAPAEGLAIGTRALALYPTREDLHLAVIKCHAASGNAGLAIRQFEVLERMLDDQWGERPSPEAYRVLDSLPKADHTRTRPAEVELMRLPESIGAFYGRTDELRQVAELLLPGSSAPRIITLTGLGGTGKTRLAEQAFLACQGVYGARCWYLALDSATEPGDFAAKLAAVLGVQEKSEEPMSVLANKIGHSEALLVLDNLEQLLPAIAGALDDLVETCPALRILATSRIPLDAANEMVVSVGPLPIPEEWRDLEGLRANPSVQILVDAAQHVRMGFAVTAANAQSVYELTRHLEGIPLALELAASHLAFKTPAQVLGSLGRRTDIPAKLPRPEKHRSLSAVISWSVDQLDARSRDAFGCLGVCRGGFTFDLAKAILGDDAEECLEQLSRASLATWQESASEVRFSMLETVREAALDRLAEMPGEESRAIAAHFAYVESLVCRGVDPSDLDALDAWADDIDRERANVIAALEAAAAGVIEPERAWTVASGISNHVMRRGQFHRWISCLQGLLEGTEYALSPRAAAGAHAILARVAYGMRDISATFQHWRKGIERADESGDKLLRAEARSSYTNAAALYGYFDLAKKEVELAIEILEELGNVPLLARCQLVLGWLQFDQCLKQEAIEPCRKALALAEQTDNKRLTATALYCLASVTAETDYAEANRLFDRSIAILRHEGGPEALAFALYNRAMVDYQRGNLNQAEAHIRAAFKVYMEHGVSLGQVPLTVAGNLFSALGDLSSAEACWMRAERARRRHKMALFPLVRADFEGELARHGMNEVTLWARFDPVETETESEFVRRLFFNSVAV